MRLFSGSLPPTLAPNVRARTRTLPLAGTRIATSVPAIVAILFVPMVGVTVWLALTSDHLRWPLASALLVSVAASATLLAVENGALEGELRASRARILEAGHAERRRIERDLHDSAQQRLVALRIHLALVGEQLEREQEREMLESLGVEVDQAIEELRDLARGLYPQLMGPLGLPAALGAVARRSAIPVRISQHGLTRHAEGLETTIYFCCVECLQNAAKHAGPDASVTIRLGQSDCHLSFSVEDDGAGFDPAHVEPGAGLTNLADRLAAVGGTLEIDASPGNGTRITGAVPT